MNCTLFDCRFKGQVETKSGQLFDVTAALPKYVNLPDKGYKMQDLQRIICGQEVLGYTCAIQTQL